MYEVIAFQWLTVLQEYQSQPKENSSNSTVSFAPLVPSAPSINAYPISLKVNSSSAKTPRSLAVDHGPILLKIILKSLILRISREKKQAPVVLDSQFFNVLCSLVSAIASETVAKTTSYFGARNLTLSLSQFLRSLFAVAVPGQVSLMIQSYFTSLRGRIKIEETELKLQVLEELALFDHFVAVNFPLTTDSSLSLMHGSLGNIDSSTLNRMSYRSSLILNSSVDPCAHWLAELMIQECIGAYRQVEQKVRELSLKILSDLVIRLSYDARYQSESSRQRISVLFLPLLGEIIKDADMIAKKNHNSTERRQLLVLFLYLLQDLPTRIFREQLRRYCEFPSSSSTPSSVGKSDSVEFSVEDTSVSGSPRDSLSARISTTSQQSPTTLHDKPIHLWNILTLLHLCLDTFEVTESSVTATSTTSLLTSISNTGGTLSPLASLVSAVDINSNIPVAEATLTGGSGGVIANAAVSNVSNVKASASSVDQLEKLRINRKAMLTPSGWTAGNSATSSRKWLLHTKKIASTMASKSSNTLTTDPETFAKSLQSISVSCASIVSRTLTVILEECPARLLYSIPMTACPRFHSSHVQERNGYNSDCFLTLMESVLSVVLHGLFNYQSDTSIIGLFQVATNVLRHFGARLFVLAVGDSMQDWIRIVLKMCSLHSTNSKDTACNFLLLLLRSYFIYFGSITVLADIMMSVLDDVISSILEIFNGVAHSFENEDDLLAPLVTSFQQMKSAAIDKMSHQQHSKSIAFYFSLKKIMVDLELLLSANAQLRRHLSHPVGYDWLGMNMLDGPFDQRMTEIIHTLRNQRKWVTTGNVTGVEKYQKMDLEEVMEMFVRSSDLFDPIRLPRQRIQWLENLSRLHEIRMNRAEGAEVRWKIFKICNQVRSTWNSQWAPRKPLDWVKGDDQRNESFFLSFCLILFFLFH